MTKPKSTLVSMFAAVDQAYIASPRAASTKPAPAYAASDCQSLLSTKSTSKSVIARIFERKSSDSSSTRRRSDTVDPVEAKHAARATYFSIM